MITIDSIKDLGGMLEVQRRFQNKKARIPDGEDVRKYFSKKDRAIVDKGMKRFWGFGMEGPRPFVPFIPFNERRKRSQTDASSDDDSRSSAL